MRTQKLINGFTSMGGRALEIAASRLDLKGMNDPNFSKISRIITTLRLALHLLVNGIPPSIIGGGMVFTFGVHFSQVAHAAPTELPHYVPWGGTKEQAQDAWNQGNLGFMDGHILVSAHRIARLNLTTYRDGENELYDLATNIGAIKKAHPSYVFRDRFHGEILPFNFHKSIQGNTLPLSVGMDGMEKIQVHLDLYWERGIQATVPKDLIIPGFYFNAFEKYNTSQVNILQKIVDQRRLYLEQELLTIEHQVAPVQQTQAQPVNEQANGSITGQDKEYLDQLLVKLLTPNGGSACIESPVMGVRSSSLESLKQPNDTGPSNPSNNVPMLGTQPPALELSPYSELPDPGTGSETVIYPNLEDWV